MTLGPGIKAQIAIHLSAGNQILHGHEIAESAPSQHSARLLRQPACTVRMIELKQPNLCERQSYVSGVFWDSRLGSLQTLTASHRSLPFALCRTILVRRKQHRDNVHDNKARCSSFRCYDCEHLSFGLSPMLQLLTLLLAAIAGTSIIHGDWWLRLQWWSHSLQQQQQQQQQQQKQQQQQQQQQQQKQ